MTAGDVLERYTDARGEERRVDPSVRDAVVAAMGAAPRYGSGAAVVRPGGALPAPGTVTLEDGAELGRVEALPADSPYGYHRLIADDGAAVVLIVGPGRCALPRELREWGWAIQLAATRSQSSWGIGDLADLRELAGWSAGGGAGFLAVGPLGAPNPGPDPEPSPYYPSTRRFANPLHLRVEQIAGADGIDELLGAGRALNGERRIDRARVLALKLEALGRIWRAGRIDRVALDAWRADRGTALERWATFVVLTERLGAGWQSWPEEYRAPDRAAVRAVAADERDRVAFHAWVQWCLDLQLEAASQPMRRIADMPVGVDPGGFDAWDWQDRLALGASIGAPPDRFNAAGQDWGLPPFVPSRLREAGYGPFIETIRAQLRHAGGLRIDHVLGLFRLWWIPSGSDPTMGAYVRQPTDELLEIVAIESQRAGAVIVGEDLGTVPPGVRSELRRRRILSTRLALFERRPPSRYPRQAFAAVTTHDLPTIAGAWSRADLDDQAEAGLEPDAEGLSLLRSRLARAAGTPADADAARVTRELHRRLAASPAMLVAATLEDALGVKERPNLPGTVAPQRPNWSLALPRPLDELIGDERVRSLARAMRR